MAYIGRDRTAQAARPCLEILEERTVPTLLGNALFPADNPWNQTVNAAPVSANSSTLVGSIGVASHVHADFGSGLWDGARLGIPYNVVAGTQPKVAVVVDDYADESDRLSVPIPANAVIEGDPRAGAANDGDRHLLVYDRDNNIVYELYNARRPGETSDSLWHASSEAVWDLKQNSFRTPGFTSADAAGLPILPGPRHGRRGVRPRRHRPRLALHRAAHRQPNSSSPPRITPAPTTLRCRAWANAFG